MDFLTQKLDNFLAVAGGIFLNYGSVFSISSLLCALLVATGHFAFRRYQRGRRIRFRTLVAALFPRRIIAHRSTRADLAMFVINGFVLGGVLGFAAISGQAVYSVVHGGLTGMFGPLSPSALPEWSQRVLVTLVLFLAYEFGYWFEHYLSHRVPILWAFHKVHHSAEHLTPLTQWRMHPVNAITFGNILALSLAVPFAVLSYVLGGQVKEYAFSGTNVLLVVFIHLYIHLQHSEVWIPFRGIWGRIFMSPAHHQVHHSNNPIHFDKNMGSCLSIWDWAFGTLYVPAKENEHLTFGVDAAYDVNTLEAGLVTPFIEAGKQVGGLISPRPSPARQA